MNDSYKQSFARENPLAGPKGSELCRTGFSLKNSIFSIALCIAVLPQMSVAQGGADQSQSQATLIRDRIETMHKQQAEYLEKVTSGEVTPNADLQKQWPKIQTDVFAVRSLIDGLNKLDIDDPERPAVETKLFSSLQQIGLYLVPSDHPPFTPRELDEKQLAEMTRIENAIENIAYGDRENAKPVEVIGSSPLFTMVHLPVPLVLKSLPKAKIYLAATTGGAFSNGLSLIELETDENGIAETTWVSIGEAVGTCYISMYSKIAIESQEIQLEVVSPSLAVLEGLPEPDKALMATPNVLTRSIPRSK